MGFISSPEPQAWVDCEKCKHFETDIATPPCHDCLTCSIRCGYEEGNDVRSEEDERGDCTGCEKYM